VMKQAGLNVPHDHAIGHVTGESAFIDDFPPQRGELYVGWAGSPVASGRIKSIQLDAARAIPGVRGLYTHADLGGHNLIGPIIVDEPVLPETEVSYIGQPVVVIAADNRRAMQKARKAIVIEVEETPPVLSIQAAIAKDAYLGFKRRIRRGNPEEAIASAPHVIEGMLEIGGQEQF